MRLSRVFVVLVALSAAFAGSAAAGPYAFVARYGQGKDMVVTTLKPRVAIPGDARDAQLADLAIRFPEGPVGLFPAKAYSEISVEVEVDGEPVDAPPTKIKGDAIKGGAAVPVFLWDNELLPRNSVVRIKFIVKGTLSPAFLCAVESWHRTAKGKDRGVAKDVNPLVGRKVADIFTKGLPSHAIVDKANDEIFASYCEGREINPSGLNLDKENERLRAALKSSAKTFFSDDTTVKDDLTIEDSFSVNVLRTGEFFGAFEYTPDGVRGLSNMVDIDSQISFSAVDDEGSGYCPQVQGAPFRYEIQERGKDDSRTSVTPTFMEDCEFLLDVKLATWVNKRLVVRARYDLDDGKSLLVYEREFEVRELGFTMTLPVLTELSSIAKGWSKDQMRAQSSIPLSYAIGTDGAKDGVAITFPWKITYASRTNPNLSQLVAFYPHLSVIVTPADPDDGPFTFAAGVGVSFAQTLHFAWGLGFSGPQKGDNYVLIGFDIKDIADLKPGL